MKVAVEAEKNIIEENGRVKSAGHRKDEYMEEVSVFSATPQRLRGRMCKSPTRVVLACRTTPATEWRIRPDDGTDVRHAGRL